jgi:hypothetical protein
MQPGILASDDIVTRYLELFINRRAYTIQSSTPDKEKRRCYYYRPKKHPSLSRAILRNHLEAKITIGLYAINPETQRCKWVAIDADYSDALSDLLKLQWELRQDGVDAALEKSRRGGHLWIFTERPLLASDCRLYIHSIAGRLKVPVKGSIVPAGTASATPCLADGIEIFPKQDRLNPGEFGNAIRGPLGVHRATGRRYWFYGADYTLQAQIAYLCRLKRITEDDISRFLSGVAVAEKVPVSAKPARRKFLPDADRREFLILEHVTGKRRKSGRNYFTRCPSCARQGHDQSGDNLAISIADPRKYRCWAGCTREMIRAALGYPIPTVRTW